MISDQLKTVVVLIVHGEIRNANGPCLGTFQNKAQS